METKRVPNVKLITGGQEGVDVAGLRAAKKLGIPTGGTMPLGWLNEADSRPEYRDLYGMTECQEPGYPARTRANAKAGHITIWLGPTGSPGYRATEAACRQYGRPFVVVDDLDPETAATAAGDVMLRAMFPHDPLVLNVAGSRESRSPGIGEQAEAFLMKFLEALAASRFLG